MEKGEKLTLSGLQHFAFCRRQWALIFIEQQWQENLRTAEGNAMHRRAHDETQLERRGDTLVVRGLRVASERLTAWRCMGRRGDGRRIRSNISAARPRSTTQTPCSSADRRCVWKKCCCARFRRAVCITAKRGGANVWRFRPNCAVGWKRCSARCRGIWSAAIHRKPK